jgi:hypothetical protein
MPFVATNPEADIGRVIPDGHCVAYVRAASAAPHTSEWRRGEKVRDNSVPANTAVATFDPNNRYGNHTDGRSHAAIYINQVSEGLNVIDQWVGQPVHSRLIRFRSGSSTAVNDGDQYFVIEVEETLVPSPQTA